MAFARMMRDSPSLRRKGRGRTIPRCAGPGQLAHGAQVKDPRHFLLSRRREDGIIDVALVLHGSPDLARHLAVGYRT